MTLTLIAPRGLISVLLFFAIPEEMRNANFQSGVLFVVIIATSLIMAWGLIFSNKKSVLNKMKLPKDMNEKEKAKLENDDSVEQSDISTQSNENLNLSDNSPTSSFNTSQGNSYSEE